MYVLRQFMRMNGVRKRDIEDFVVALAGKKLSVREAERLVARATQPGGGGARTAKAAPKPRDIARIEERLADVLTAPVEIRLRKGRAAAGEIVIPFGSLDELDALLDKLGGSGEG